MTREVVHSIRETRPEAVAQRLEQAPLACALVEIRADDLRAGDVAGLTRRAGRPVVVTVRTVKDGGSFDGSVAEKRSILEAALAAGSAFVDVEWDGPLRDVALGPHATRSILSHHGGACRPSALGGLYGAMAETPAARLKIVPEATALRDPLAVRDLLARARGERRALCAFASGPSGGWSRVFAPAWGSWGTYGAAARGRETGEGQPESRQLLEVYRVLDISESTAVFGLCGTPLVNSPSPSMHAAGYRSLGIDAVYVPFDTPDLAEMIGVVESGGPHPLRGIGVTIPLKEAAARRCARLDAFAACGSANTVTFGEGGWEGFNTDAPAALALIRKHLELAGATAAVVGAGGTGRAIAAALSGAGADVTLFNRTIERGRETAKAIGVSAAPLTALSGASWDLLVQTTPLGRSGEEFLPRRFLNGRMVLDAAYGSEATPLVRAARARGLVVADGFDLLQEQACLQFTRLTGVEAPRETIGAALQPFRSPSA